MGYSLKDKSPFVSHINKSTILKKDTQKKLEFRLSIDTQKNRSYYSLIIPAYNEEKRIGQFLDSLFNELDESFEVIVVFDGDDRTPEVVNKYGNCVKLIQFNHRLGKGGAILEGFKAASGKVIGFADADGAIEPREIKKIAEIASFESPCVVGSRWMRDSVILKPEPFLNIFAGRVFHYLVYLILGISTKDTQCGLKFLASEVVKELTPKITITGRMMDVALLYHVKNMGIQIKEVGITWKHMGDSKLPIMKAIPTMFLILFGLRLRHSRAGQFIDKWEDYSSDFQSIV